MRAFAAGLKTRQALQKFVPLVAAHYLIRDQADVKNPSRIFIGPNLLHLALFFNSSPSTFHPLHYQDFRFRLSSFLTFNPPLQLVTSNPSTSATRSLTFTTWLFDALPSIESHTLKSSIKMRRSILIALYALLPLTTAKCCEFPHRPALGVLGQPCYDLLQESACCGYGHCNFACCHCEGRNEIVSEFAVPMGTSTFWSTVTLTAPPGEQFTCKSDYGQSIISGRTLTGTFTNEKGKPIHGHPNPNLSWFSPTKPAHHDGGTEVPVQVTIPSPPCLIGPNGLTCPRPSGIGVTTTPYTEGISAGTAVLAVSLQTMDDDRPSPTVTVNPRDATVPDAAMITADPLLQGLTEFMDLQQDESHCDRIFEKLSRGTGKIDLESAFEFFGLELHETEKRDLSDEQKEQEAKFRDLVMRKFKARDRDGDGFLNREEFDILL